MAEARREVEIEATPERVWEALVTEQGREDWLQEPDREVYVEVVEAPSRLVWWWGGEERPATRVEFLIEPIPAGARVVVIESAPVLSGGMPVLPLDMLAASLAMVAA